MKLKIFSITVEGRKDKRTGFFKTYEIQSGTVENAVNFVLHQEKAQGRKVTVEEIEELDGEPTSEFFHEECKVLEETGMVFFNLEES